MTNAVRAVSDGFAVSCFPGDDKVFCERVDEILEATRSTDPTEITDLLQKRLRVVYPKCEVRVRDPLAGFSDVAIYVFRDGTAVSALGPDEWIADASTARLVTDADGVYVDANDAAAALFGVERENIVGQRAGAFTRPDAALQDAARLWRSLAETGRLHSLALLRGVGDADARVEFITIKDGDGDGRHVTFMRVIDSA